MEKTLRDLTIEADAGLLFEEVDQWELGMEHFDDLKAEMGYETVWSMHDGPMPLEQKIFTNKPRLVTYKCIKELGRNFDDTVWQTFTCMAKDGTVGGLWAAAESCFKQAKLALDDWHIYVENFELQDDGSLELITGS
tara:strand:+ start:59 stop:469 length:411 start_codon:yes stop_codon:yes gene_type:complete